MRKILFIITFLVFCIVINSQQYLSNLNASSNDPIYTTYAASIERSDYKIDQAYHLLWYDDERGIEFTSKDGGDICIAFIKDSILCYSISQFYSKPIIKTSYSDIVVLTAEPFKEIKVELIFNVYSSGILIQDITVSNQSSFDEDLEIITFFRPTEGKISNVIIPDSTNSFTFDLKKSRDSWMDEHDIPYDENLFNIYESFDENAVCKIFTKAGESFLDELFVSSIDSDIILVLNHKVELSKNELVSIRVIRALQSTSIDKKELRSNVDLLENIDLSDVVNKNEYLYSKIPSIDFELSEHEMVYYSAYSLIRQCMMPPEGEAGYNYYVFSREPKWGWGYGGQVFHESLVMLAYAFMDPIGAMNSQRIYMERQWDNGYINYRTGPYLNESIKYDDEFTSSAPWFNYQNYEIYKITGDIDFLEEAYYSGKKFYKYYVSNRDKDNDGLCEWGAHAVLECVRDARVAVWDRVGWPSNFEAVDQNSMLIMEEKSLAEMAEILNLTEESKMWKDEAENRTKLLNETFWDDESGFFYHVDKESHNFTHNEKDDLKIKEIIGFLPLWANAVDSATAVSLLKHFKNPDEFNRKFGIPTLSADDPYYNPIGYWNGPIWIQWQYLVFRGLIDYGYYDEAIDLFNRVIDNIINQLKVDHNFWEFYSSDDYQAGWNKTYIWTGIIARMMIDVSKLKTN